MELKASVAAVTPGDSRERSSIERVLTELERLPRPLDRDADPVHVTASALIANEHGVVLHLHKLIGLWLQPGGHIELGEAPSGAALREAIEETGLRCRWTDAGRVLFHVDVHPAARGHTHLDLRYVLTAEGEPSPARGESRSVHWFTWDDAIAAADPGLVGALHKLRRTRMSSLDDADRI
jgi:8-oxo-dGTP pyrophosphatase MutT (NUDIX family)